MHKGDLSSICKTELLGGFERILFQFAFSDLTINNNLDFANYESFMKNQMLAFETAQAIFTKNIVDLDKTVSEFLVIWLNWYAYKHIEYLAPVYSGLIPELQDLISKDKSGYLANLEFEISESTIKTLFFHLKNNEEEANVKAQIATLKAFLQKHYVDLAKKLTGTANFSHDRKSIAIKFLEEGVTYFERTVVYAAFLRIDTPVVSVAPDLFFSDGYVFTVMETDQPIFELITFNGYFLINDDLFIDEQVINSLSKITTIKHSNDFLKWLNEENISDSNNFKPKVYIWYLYLHVSMNGKFNSGDDRKKVAKEILDFMLTATNCYKDLNPTLPACMVTQILDRAKYSKHWVNMYLLLTTICTDNDPTKDKNAIIKLPFWQISTNLKHVKNEIMLAYITTGVISNKIYDVIGDIRAKKETLQTEIYIKATGTTYKQKMIAQRKLGLQLKGKLFDKDTIVKFIGAFDATADGDQIGEFIVKILEEETDEVVRLGFLEVVIGFINEKLAQMESEKKVEESKRKMNKAEIAKIGKIIYKVQVLVVDLFGKEVPDEAAQGIISYMSVTLLYFGVAQPVYYFSDLANLFRGFDMTMFCLNNLNGDPRKNFAESMVAHELTNSSTQPFEFYLKDAFLINYLPSFEAMKEFLELFDYFVVVQPGIEKGKHQKIFLSTFNILYRFLATVRYFNDNMMLEPLETVLKSILACVTTRYTKPVPDNIADRNEKCPLTYSESVELAHVYIGFLLTIDKDTYLPLYKAAVQNELAKPAIRLSHFYRIVFIQDALRDTFGHLCEDADYDALPVCLGFNFIRNTLAILDYNTFEVSQEELSTSFTNYVKTAINKELTYLSDPNKAKIAQRSIVWSAISTLYEMDEQSGRFAILVDEGRMNGVTAKKAKVNAMTGEKVLSGQQKLYKTFLEAISYIPSTDTASSSINDAKDYLRLRFMRFAGGSVEVSIQNVLIAAFKKDQPFYIVGGVLIPHLAEVFVKYAKTEEHYLAAAGHLYNSGKFIVVAQWSEYQQNPFEASIYTAIKMGSDVETAINGAITSYIMTSVGKGEKLVIENENPQIDYSGDSKIAERLKQIDQDVSHVSSFVDKKIDEQIEANIENNSQISITTGKAEQKYAENMSIVSEGLVKRSSLVEKVIEEKFNTVMKTSSEKTIPQERMSTLNSDSFKGQLQIITIQITFDPELMALLEKDTITIKDVKYSTENKENAGQNALSEEAIETTLTELQAALSSKGVETTIDELEEYRDFLKQVKYRRAII